MQRRLSTFKNYTIEAPDGKAGYVTDILFQDDDWKLRWFVINAGSWLFGRDLLIRPAALGRPDIREHAFPVALTIAEVQASRSSNSDQPVFKQMEQNLNAYGASGPMWDIGAFGGYGNGSFNGMSNITGQQQYAEAQAFDPHLRGMAQVFGYAVHALDGDIGHLEDFLVDDETWQIDHAVVDTKNWGFGKHVLVPASEIKSVNWGEQYIRVDQTRYAIKCGPSWQEPDWAAPPVL